MGTWMDSDGLYHKYGVTKTTPHIAGEYVTNTNLRQIELTLDLTTLGTASTIIDDQTFFPAGYRIESVEVIAQTAAVGASAVLNLGLVRTDRTTTYDVDAFIAALPTTSMDAAGEKTTLTIGQTYVGSAVGTTTAYAGYLVADYDTAAFSQGVVVIRIKFYKP